MATGGGYDMGSILNADAEDQNAKPVVNETEMGRIGKLDAPPGDTQQEQPTGDILQLEPKSVVKYEPKQIPTPAGPTVSAQAAPQLNRFESNSSVPAGANKVPKTDNRWNPKTYSGGGNNESGLTNISLNGANYSSAQGQGNQWANNRGQQPTAKSDANYDWNQQPYNDNGGAAQYSPRTRGKKRDRGESCKSCGFGFIWMICVVTAALLVALHPWPPSSEMAIDEVCADTCNFHVVETIPEQLDLEIVKGGRSTYDVIKSIIEEAEVSLHMAVFYWDLISGCEQGKCIKGDGTVTEDTKPQCWDLITTGQDYNWFDGPVDGGGMDGCEIWKAILKARDRGVDVKIIMAPPNAVADAPGSLGMKEDFTKKCHDSDGEHFDCSGQGHVDKLRAAGAGVQVLDMGYLFYGMGIQHSKFIIQDETSLYIGSANMDWKSYSQVKELGVYLSDCGCIAQDLLKVWTVMEYVVSAAFEEYEGRDPDEVDFSRDVKTSVNFTAPAQLQIVQHGSCSKGDSFVGEENCNAEGGEWSAGSDGGSDSTGEFAISMAPQTFIVKEREWDLDAVLHTINAANSTISIEIMDFMPALLYAPAMCTPRPDHLVLDVGATGYDGVTYTDCARRVAVENTEEACLGLDMFCMYEQCPPEVPLCGQATYFPQIGDALVAAVFRGVEVRLLIGVWEHTRDMAYQYYASLQSMTEMCVHDDDYYGADGGSSEDSAMQGIKEGEYRYCKGSLTVQGFRVPPLLGSCSDPTKPDKGQCEGAGGWWTAGRQYAYTRVNHAKFIVTDTQALVSTSNWSYDYFYTTVGVSAAFNIPLMRRQLADVFERDWGSKYRFDLPREKKCSGSGFCSDTTKTTKVACCGDDLVCDGGNTWTEANINTNRKDCEANGHTWGYGQGMCITFGQFSSSGNKAACVKNGGTWSAGPEPKWAAN